MPNTTQHSASLGGRPHRVRSRNQDGRSQSGATCREVSGGENRGDCTRYTRVRGCNLSCDCELLPRCAMRGNVRLVCIPVLADVAASGYTWQMHVADESVARRWQFAALYIEVLATQPSATPPRILNPGIQCAASCLSARSKWSRVIHSTGHRANSAFCFLFRLRVPP